MLNIKRGDVFYVNLGSGIGSEQMNERPCVIIQNDVGNTYSPTTIIACLTTQKTKKSMPTHVFLTRKDALQYNSRFVDSLVLCEQIRTIDKQRLSERVAKLTPAAMDKIDKALKISVFKLPERNPKK